MFFNMQMVKVIDSSPKKWSSCDEAKKGASLELLLVLNEYYAIRAMLSDLVDFNDSQDIGLTATASRYIIEATGYVEPAVC